MEGVLKTPHGNVLPPSPEGKATARRLWAEADAKTAAKGVRDELTAEELRAHEKILREQREAFEQEERNREQREQRE